MAHSEIVWGATVQECRAAGWDLMRRMADFILEEPAKRYERVTVEEPDKKGRLRKKHKKIIVEYVKKTACPLTCIATSSIHRVKDDEWPWLAHKLNTPVEALDRARIVYAAWLRFVHEGE
jgi:hypothetical protein